MKTKRILIAMLAATLLASSCKREGLLPVDYVNPYIGSISHMLVPTHPTVHLPNSMMRVYPLRTDFTGNRLKGLPLIVTRHRNASTLNLFPHQQANLETFTMPDKTLGYSHEKITPYRYSVYLDEIDVEVDYAPSHQSAIYNIVYDPAQTPYLIFSFPHGKLQAKACTISGYQSIDAHTKIYIYAETNIEPYTTLDASNNELILVYPSGTATLGIRYGVSLISEDQARKNLEREIAGFDVATVATEGRRIWNEVLAKINIEGGTDNDKALFYTSLYRVYERPVMISEDGQYYSGFDHQVHKDGGINFYTDDWIWDTYRAAHPLRILIDAAVESDIITSYTLMAEQSEHGAMPTFPGVSGDSRSMNSNHGVAMVADAYIKGLNDVQLEKAYEACRRAIEERSLIPWSDIPSGELDVFFRTNGYFPALSPGEIERVQGVHSWEKRQPVAVTLGTAYDYWCLSLIAHALNKHDDARRFEQLGYAYRNLFNPATGFFHPKDRYGFIPDIDYRISGGPGARDYYDENNAYIYRWDVQHNISDLVQMIGGDSSFIAALEDMYNTPYGMSRWEFYNTLPDHTGNVGMFSMANEPSLHVPYLYNYAGAPWLTQKRIRNLLRQWFRNDLMGIPGDEDGGGMSAFVVFSQMGFYPVTPGSPTYNIGSPIFTRIKIDLGNNKYFEIKADNASEDNLYIQSATLNGSPLNQCWFGHDDIREGGKLEVVMGSKPNRLWGTGVRPPSAIDKR